MRYIGEVTQDSGMPMEPRNVKVIAQQGGARVYVDLHVEPVVEAGPACVRVNVAMARRVDNGEPVTLEKSLEMNVCQFAAALARSLPPLESALA